MTGFTESPLALAGRQVAEAEQRQARQNYLIAGLVGNEEALVHAQQVLAEITRTLVLARAYRSLLLSVPEAE
ncbi:hypothetical protein J2X36_004509 [Methylobacterium sp. BE186]|uniref:hypothetical protein n=1 Tax=Methylobacterium sp. BE186 TaxID=2817715 RepID=UPI002866073A|nr:hypothetical protein [Methylobacterium sp. BE186]MDR7039731.1 hypothetical protein [Methylobacterium sp. BE186]